MKKALILCLWIPAATAFLGGPAEGTSRDLNGSCNFICWLLRVFLPQYFGGRCEDSSDCGDEQYCGAGICQAYGYCRSELDCRNPDNLYPVIECTGPLVCDDFAFTCGRICGPSCEDGTEGVACERSPCDVADSICSNDFVSCQTDYCGECSALVFDAAGHPEECFLPGPVSCSQTSDCGEDEYCSSGTCTAKGKCSSEADCFNPDNLYPVIECVGPIGCDDDGQCGRTCTGSFCPDDEPTVQCLLAPCTAIALSCNETIANCVDDYCGGCNAYVFDAAGFQICEEPTTCSSASDCGSDEYCAAGECLPNGKCEKDLDCLNPSNSYPLPACVGVIGCESDKKCGIQCGTSFCPPGSNEVKCFVNPCDFPPSCQESWEYCTPNYCDGECGVILFDAAGNEVNCTSIPP